MTPSLTDRVELLRPQRIVDEGGGYSFGFTSLGTVATKAEGHRSAIDGSLEQNQRRMQREFLMRSRNDLVFEMRLVHRGKTFRITDIQDQDEKGRFTLVRGEEIMQ
ncbi:head-tail adaptor protein [Parvularcula lutaonensis]|uniref:Head-tail adaptor protein n=1 Tax=Parvularcula lutaonensis TaxID=491923 RepID=A0ABV7MDR2_9PROT|nr:head-tail adaptor protein [Parvularcula lutaonensis]GGY53197.1 hypothetical protein GCM10007148_23040 [Parvularcula lutaonensis]